MKRRKFIENAALGGLAFGLHSFRNFPLKNEGEIPRRALGRTGEKLSIVGFGGIILNENSQDYANNLISKVYDASINYFDIAPSYGNAINKFGDAFKPFRKQCFLACKTMERTAQGAEKELNSSLSVINTDYFDLYQLHALSSVDEVERAFAPGGAMETILKAKEQGKIRYIGFSAHDENAALAAMNKFNFDTILYPLNINCWQNGNFGPSVYKQAISKDMGVLALKAMAMTTLKPGEKKLYKNVWYRPMQDPEMAKLGLRYTLTKNITSAIPPGDEEFFWYAVEAARNYRPITPEETERLTAYIAENKPVFINREV